MKLAESHSDVDRQAQEAIRLQGRAEQSLEQRAAGIIEDQHGPSAFADEPKRPYRPCPVQLVFQSIFVSEMIDGSRCWMFNGRQHGQYTEEVTVGATLSSAEEAFPVLPQDLEIAILICAEQSGEIQLPHSTLKRRSRAETFIRPSHRLIVPQIMKDDKFSILPGTQPPGVTPASQPV